MLHLHENVVLHIVRDTMIAQFFMHNIINTCNINVHNHEIMHG